MARPLSKLTDIACKAAEPGMISDGGGLYLHVKTSGTKSWAFIWKQNVLKDGEMKAKRTEIGLGPYPAISLKKARILAQECRELLADGRNPMNERESARIKAAEPTFGECADKFMESMSGTWRNEKHRGQWKATVRDYCGPIRDKKVSEIETADVLKVLNPMWSTKHETASRLRGRIERVLDYAKVKGWRSGENPALWRGHLRNVLPARQKVQRKHLPAMPYPEVPAFMQRVRGVEALAARALEFAILTAARSGEVLGATWSEVDLDRKVWSIPKERMKAGQAHSVPLSGRAVELLSALKDAATGDYVFPGEKSGKPLSNMSMAMFMRRLKVTDVTVHGFRSSFRDWCGDATTFPRELAEAALAHQVGSEVERAYRRADALEKRRKLMQAWADYLSVAKSSNVVPIGKKIANP